MNFIHYTTTFQETVEDSRLAPIKKKIEDLRFIDKPEALNSIDSYSKGILVLKFYGAFMCRIIIQSEWLEIQGKRVHVYFVRDCISKKGFDYFWGSVTHPQLSSGEWQQANPLPETEISKFKSNYLAAFPKVQNNKLPLPDNLTGWLKDFKITLSFDVYEREEWVKYSHDRSSEGLQEKHIIFFRDTIKGILDKKEKSKVRITRINEQKAIYTAIYEPFNTGIIFSEYHEGGITKIVLYDGAHLKDQESRWNEALKRISLSAQEKTSILDISKDAFRAYPKWIVTNDGEELWTAIQRFDGSHNLSLLPEQVDFLNTFKFPAYINGQAGSGKSTMLYYLFANVYFYKCAGQDVGDIIFLTENDNLLEHTCKSIIGLLSNNPEFNVGLSLEERNGIRNHFFSFRNYLLGILPSEVQEEYPAEKYMDFAKFKEKFNARFLNRKYSAEEVWFVISTYVYGYYEDYDINTIEKYTDDKRGIPNKFQIVNNDNFEYIVKNHLSFYDKLIKDGWWDKITLVRRIRQYYPGPLPKQYAVVFCDEAQDFSRIELRLIIQSSEFTKYDLSEVDQIPIVFAGDALQTVSPTGFSDTRLHQMYYDAFDDAYFKYDKERSTYNPHYNYRSRQPIVRLANIIQNYRKECLSEDVVIKQFAKRDKMGSQIPMVHSKEWLTLTEIRSQFEEKFKYKSFIVPVDLNEETEYVKSQELLNDKFADIKSSIDAKGAEYSQVVVYGFGDHYLKEFGLLKWTKGEFDFKKKFFFNKLYVALTRAQNELIIIDSNEGCEAFWEKLLTVPEGVKKWEDYADINDVLPINPQTGLNDVQDSTPDEALSNATVDMEQGIMDKNTARLVVASNVFLMLGKVEEANNCLGHKDAIKGQWTSAGSYFLKAKNLEEASNAFFHGQIWGELFNSATKTLSGNKQEVRTLVGNLMQDAEWNRKELGKVYELRHLLTELIRDISWFGMFKDKLLKLANKVASMEFKRELAFVIDSIIREQDVELWDKLGDLYFETKQFNFAIQAWDQVIYQNTVAKYTPKYISAQIEKAKDEVNSTDELLWSARYMHLEENEGIKASFAKRVLNIYAEQEAKLLNSEIKLEVLSSGLDAAVVLNEVDTVVKIARLIENTKKLEWITETYAKAIHACKSFELAIFLKERWACIAWKVIKSDAKESETTLLYKLNSTFSDNKFPFVDSNLDWSLQELQNIPEQANQINQQPKEHVRDFFLRDFRKFQELEIKGLGQFNLILGDNNSGKTTVLEALLFSTEPTQCLLSFLYARRQRNNNSEKEKDHNFLDSLVNRNNKEKEVHFLYKEGRRLWSYKIRHPKLKELVAKLGVDKLDPNNFLAVETGHDTVAISDSIEEVSNYLKDTQWLSKIPYVPFGKGYSDRLTAVYHNEIGSKRKVQMAFIKQMETFIPNIVGITVDPETDAIKIEEEINGKDYVSNLNDFGEGANKLFRILVQLHAAKDKKLMVDEIDAGIHFTRFKPFWKVILQAAKEYNVQVFATTHNEECIKYFWEVLQEDDFSGLRPESRIVTLESHVVTGKVLSIVRDYDNMFYSNEHNLEMRGGKL
jgi:AAA15 family ATPase/GTPase